MSREPLVDSLKALGFTLGKYTHPFGEIDPTKAATYTVFAEATDAEAEAALRSLVGDAAELRAALREWAEATQDAEWFELDQSNAYGGDHREAEDRVEAARRALLALAAAEGQP